jgi:hypothetical protein
MSRELIARTIADVVGARPYQLRSGWPSEINVTLDGVAFPLILLHVAPLTTHSRGIPGEIRVQPPGQNRPVEARGGAVPMIIGRSTNGLLVGIDAYSRIGRVERWSVTFREQLIQAAERDRWAVTERMLETGIVERIYAFHPSLFPVYAEMVRNRVALTAQALAPIISGTGLMEDPADASASRRARRAASILVRQASFTKHVVAAYGARCALCELPLGLVSGAHILPVAAPHSTDVIGNGICLCDTHHRAFDKHLLYIDPDTLAVTWHPRVLAERTRDPAVHRFLSSTAPVLRAAAGTPGSDFFRARYTWFAEQYSWVAGT